MSDTTLFYEDPKNPWSARFIRLTDPAYYVPENPYTDDEGFLKGEGRQPQWVNDNHLVVVEWLDGARSNARPPYMHDWGKVAKYKIIGEEQEEHPTEETDHRREAAERIVQFICESEPRQETVDAQEILAEHNLERLICVPPDVLVQLIENALDPVDMDEVRKSIGEQEEPGKPELPQGTTKPAATDSWATDRPSTSENGDDPEQFVLGDQVPFVDKPRPPSDASAEQRTLDDDKARERYEDERRHRNELAARTLTSVPGMDSFMHDVIRKARRQRYREAALAPVFHGLGDKCGYHETAARLATDLADAIIEKEDSE